MRERKEENTISKTAISKRNVQEQYADGASGKCFWDATFFFGGVGVVLFAVAMQFSPFPRPVGGRALCTISRGRRGAGTIVPVNLLTH